jgi:hypothetical protein
MRHILYKVIEAFLLATSALLPKHLLDRKIFKTSFVGKTETHILYSVQLAVNLMILEIIKQRRCNTQEFLCRAYISEGVDL